MAMNDSCESFDALVAEVRASEEYKSLPDQPEPWYNEDGDSLVYIAAPEETIGCWINHYFTLYLSAINRRVIGFKIKDIRALAREFDADGTVVSYAYSDDGDGGVKIAWLLMAALMKSPKPNTQAFDAVAEMIKEKPDLRVKIPAAA